MPRKLDDHVQRVLVTPDLHFRAKGGGLDKRAWNCMLQYAAAHEWDAHINLGDVMDFSYISEYNRGKPGKVAGESFLRDYEYANKRLDEVGQALGACPTHYILEGNHDERVKRYLAYHPELVGSIDVPHGLHLAERGWTWVPFWSLGHSVQIGKAMFIHGRYTNEYHAKYSVHHYNKNVFYGHCLSYDTEVLTKRGWVGPIGLLDSDEVATFNTETKKLEFQDYDGFVHGEPDSGLIEISGKNNSLLVTDKHVLLTAGDSRMTAELVESMAPGVSLRSCAVMDKQPIDLSDDEIRLVVWIAADGSLQNPNYGQNACRWRLKKERKVSRLTGLLTRLGIRYSIKVNVHGVSSIYCNLKGREKIRSLFKWGKKSLPGIIAKCCREQALIVVEEYGVTDGSTRAEGRNYQIMTAKLEEAEVLQTMCVTNGIRCNLHTRKNGLYCLFVTTYDEYGLPIQRREIRRVLNWEPTWCLTVPNGTLLVRRNGKTSIVGNCHDVMCYSRSSHGGYKKLSGRTGLYTSDQTTMVGQSLGTLCELNQDYMQGKPTNWQHAFGTFFFFPDGNFTYYVTLIFNGRCVGPDGKVYRA